MTPDRDQDGQGERWSRERMIDEILDGEVSPERSSALLHELRRDARACEALARARLGIERLREPLPTPDLSDRVLARVHARRGFLPRRRRRLVTAARVAVLTGLLAALGLGSYMQRRAPAVRLAPGPAPVTRIVEATTDAGAGPLLSDSAVETLRASVASPGRGLKLAPRLRPEDRWHFDLSLARRPPGAPRFAGMGPGDATLTVVAAPVPAAGPGLSAEAPASFITRFDTLLVVLRRPLLIPDDADTGGHEGEGR